MEFVYATLIGVFTIAFVIWVSDQFPPDDNPPTNVL